VTFHDLGRELEKKFLATLLYLSRKKYVLHLR
jgi:hypothetical protein